MAPPRTRRPGHSRRIQLGLFLSYVIAIVGAVFGLALALIARFDPEGYGMLRGVALDVGAPFSAAARSVTATVDGAGDSIGDYFFATSKNQAMRSELERARRALIQAKALQFENARLKQTLQMVEHTPQTVVTTRLIGSSLMSPRRFATLSAGSNQGVRPGQPVLAPDGLIGRTLETGRTAARVMLLTDGESSVPVRLTRNGAPALTRGGGNGTLQVHSLLPGVASFRRGDLLVTSGTGGIYPPNIPVAVVTRSDRNGAEASPLAHPDRMDFAIVIRPYQPTAVPPPPTVAGETR